MIFSVQTTSSQAGIGALHRPEGRHFTFSSPIKLFPLLHENDTSALSPVDVSSDISNPGVLIIDGHCTCNKFCDGISNLTYTI